MSFSWRNIRAAFLLQVAIVCLVVVLCMLGLEAVNGHEVQPLTIVAIFIALGAIGTVSWMTYHTTRRMLAPVHWLLRVVGRWDPLRPDTRALSPELIPRELQGDVRKIADALHVLGKRVDSFVARERDFTRAASHELRTPLTVIRVATDLIGQDAGLSARSRRSLGRIQAASASMEALMDALLLLARDEQVPLETEDFHPREVLEAELDKVRPLLEDKQVGLELQIDANPELHAAPRAFQVIVGNLLSNAVRFTDSGSVRVRLADDALEIEDTGIGMAAAELGRAFERFHRCETALAALVPGLSHAQRLGRR